MVNVRYPSQLQAELLPEGALPEFRLTLPEIQFPEEVNLTELLLDRNLGADKAQRIAYYSGDRQVTYQALHHLVQRMGNGLRGLGIGKGDRVILRIPNSVEFMVCALAIHRLGAIAIPTMVLLKERVLTYVANTSEAKAIICSHDMLDEVELGRDKYQTVENVIAVGGDRLQLKAQGYLSYDELIESSNDQLDSVKVRRDDIAVIFFTSGTTGMPKGCMHMHQTLLAAAHLVPHVWDVRPTDVVCGTAPLAFVFGYGYLGLAALYCGIPSVFMEGRVTPEVMLETIQKYQVSLFHSVPPAYNQMLNVPDAEKIYDLSSLRLAVSGGAPLQAPTVQRMKEQFGADMLNTMGSTETFAAYFSTRKPGTKPWAVGHPFPSWEARALDEHGNDAPPGVPGRLALKGIGGIMYWKNPEKQQESVVDGWSLTGDLVYKDEDGCFWYVTRGDDVIKSRGYRISPGEIEDALLEHAAVFESAVVGSPDPLQGERVKAFVVLKENRQGSAELGEEMRAFVRSRIAAYMVPAEIEFVQSLPKTETGKIRRIELKQLEKERHGADH